MTGSNGKTTTKEMVAAVVAQRWRTLKTEGNLNNRIGVAHTLFRLTPRYGAAVVEMGVDDMGQTARLCEIARPTLGLITNIGPAATQSVWHLHVHVVPRTEGDGLLLPWSNQRRH